MAVDNKGKMELEIQNQTYSFVFGFNFLQLVNKKYKLSQTGMELGMGVTNIAAGLQIGDAEMLINTLLWANATEKPRLLQKDIDVLFENYEPEQLFEEVMQALETSFFTRTALKKAMSQTEE